MPIVSCEICSKDFYAKQNWLNRGWGKYCSRKCQSKSQLKGRFVYCDQCDKKIWRAPAQLRNSRSGKFFCTKSCQTLWRNKLFSGSNHPLWTGGLRKYRDILLKTKNPIMCVRCGYNNEKVLVVHHKDENRKNNKIKNLEWLCRNCHYMIHNIS